MARTRAIKPQFFQNEFLAECEPMARLLFIGLWTLADRDGRLELRPARIKAQLFPYENCDVPALLGQLADRGFVLAYEVNGVKVLEIPKFSEHQRCHPDERSEPLPAREDGQAVNFSGEPGNPAREPGNFPASCAFYLLPSSSYPTTSNPLSAPTKPAPRSRSKPPDSLRWSATSGWEGITAADHADWSQAYPAADVKVELAKAHQWLLANPRKATKSNWRRWLTTTWLTRCQDRGGTHREAARPGAPPPVDQTRKRFFRSDSQQNQTDAEYAAWRKQQRQAEGAPA
jgi:hypothetical protein